MPLILGVTDPEIIGARIMAARRAASRSRLAERRAERPYCYRCGQRVPILHNGHPKKHDCLLIPLPMDAAESAWVAELGYLP